MVCLFFYDRQTKISLNHQKKKPMRHPRSIQGGGGGGGGCGGVQGESKRLYKKGGGQTKNLPTQNMLKPRECTKEFLQYNDSHQ